MKNNQNYEDTKSSKTRNFKLYKSREAFKEDFSTGKMLSGVIVKMLDGDENLCLLWRKGEELVCVGEGKIQWWQGMFKDSIYTMLLFCFQKRKTVGFYGYL